MGCDACIQVPKEQRRKLNDKAEKLTFLGYSEESKDFSFLQKESNRVKIRHDMIFIVKIGATEDTQITEIVLQ